LSTVEALADVNLKALADMGLPRPSWVGGYSFGGIVAFEMARQLSARGTPPQRVVIIDTPAPLKRSSILPRDPDRAHAEWLVRMGDVRARFQGVAPVLPLDALLSLSVEERFDFALKRLHEARLLPPAADVGWLERAHKTSLVQYAAYLAYDPDPMVARGLRLALIRASAPRRSDLGELENIQLEVPDQGWQTFTDAPVEVVRVLGDHVTMLNAENAQSVAEAIVDLMTAQDLGTQRSVVAAMSGGRRQHENGRVA
jgi:thioesterase domain-containing protein